MPINELIARGVAPIGQDLPQVAGMLNQRRQQEEMILERQQRNALLQQQVGMQNKLFEQGQADRGTAEHNRKIEHIVNSAKALASVAQDPAQFAAARSAFLSVPGNMEILGEFQIDPAQITPENVTGLLAQLGAGGGVAPPPGPDPRDILAQKKFEWEQKQAEGDRSLDWAKFNLEKTKAAREANNSGAPEQQNVASAQMDAENVAEAIKSAKSLVSSWSTGAIGQVMGNVGGTKAYDLRAAINTIGSNVAFDRLQRMREASKTGGALGAISERELTLLMSTIASLDANQSEGKLREGLARVSKQYDKAMSAFTLAMEKEAGAGAAPAQPGAQNIMRFDAQGNPIP